MISHDDTVMSSSADSKCPVSNEILLGLLCSPSRSVRRPGKTAPTGLRLLAKHRSRHPNQTQCPPPGPALAVNGGFANQTNKISPANTHVIIMK